jgi:hypothetical protein
MIEESIEIVPVVVEKKEGEKECDYKKYDTVPLSEQTDPSVVSSPAPLSSFSELLAYADYRDITMMVLGIAAAILSGVNQPAQLIVFGSLLNSFNNGGDGLDKVNFLAAMYLALACQVFILSDFNRERNAYHLLYLLRLTTVYRCSSVSFCRLHAWCTPQVDK